MACRRALWFALLLPLLAGCGSAPPPAGTGAREVVAGYFTAVAGRSWEQAYAALHPDSRKACSPEQFALVLSKTSRLDEHSELFTQSLIGNGHTQDLAIDDSAQSLFDTILLLILGAAAAFMNRGRARA